METRSLRFEQGPIRPPNEASSFLLRVTRNCPWNQCLFCPIYKGKKFSLRSVEEIKKDIQTARYIREEIVKLSRNLGFYGDINAQVINYVFNSGKYGLSYKNMAAWLYHDTGACFLQDADNLLMKTDDLIEVLDYLREKFPEVKRVTTYSRSRTIIRKPVDSLKRLKEAGLDRIHVGLESGYDPVLKMVKKGVTSEQHIQAGRNVIGAGIELSEYVMPGLGGQEMWREHAQATAETLNRINPHFIRLRSLRIPYRVPLAEKVRQGEFTIQTDDMIVNEIELFIEKLDGITSRITSDHIMNLLEEVGGKFSEDKDKMLQVIKKYKDLPELDKLVYRAGRRSGVFRSVDDIDSNPELRKQLEAAINTVIKEKGDMGFERLLCEMADQYI
ncbi:MAG: radical SAM protein [Deltaproteobacteria bacterium]|nr:radical SAM protein [Deltaproteobacteria bacterium]